MSIFAANYDKSADIIDNQDNSIREIASQKGGELVLVEKARVKVKNTKTGIQYNKLSYRESKPRSSKRVYFEYDLLEVDEWLSPGGNVGAGKNDGLSMSIGLGMSRNLKIGSLSGIFFFKKNNVTLENNNTVELNGFQLSGEVLLDNIFENPYIAPFIRVSAINYRVIERSSIESKGDTSVFFGYSGGFMFQLNWIDKVASRDGYIDWGMQNVYFTTMITNWGEVENDEELISFKTKPFYSLGIHIEF